MPGNSGNIKWSPCGRFLLAFSSEDNALKLMGSATGLKLGGPKPLLNLKVSRSLILIYKFIKLSKILIHAFKY